MLVQNRYRIIELIAQTGFGKTFFGVDESLSPPYPCIIKQLSNYNQTPESLSQVTKLEQEAILLRELGQNPQIPALLDYFTENEYFYSIQQFIDGTNLAKSLETEGTFSEAQIGQILNDLLPVIKFIHDHQIIHRDIKPENIIRRHAGHRLFLIDFRVAKRLTIINSLQIEANIGSAEYVAPEQAKGKAVFASDLYSLGVTCIYLLTGISPFHLFDTANNCWVWRQYILEKTSGFLAEILDKLIANDLNCRYQSADEVLKDINKNSQLDKVAKTSIPHLVKPFATLTKHSGLFATINAVAISPTGDILASASDDKTIKLWHLETGEEITTFIGHSNFVKSIAFSPDGEILASGSDDKTIKLWHIGTGKEICTLNGHSHTVKSVAFHPHNQILASGSWDKTIKLWNINTKELICTLTGHQLQVNSVAFSPNGKLLASASFDRTVRLWNCENLTPPPPSLQGKGENRDVSSSLEGKGENENFSPPLAGEGLGERFPQLCYILTNHSWPVFAVTFSPDSQILATGRDDKTIKLWDTNTGEEIRTLSGHSWSIVTIAFSEMDDPIFKEKGIGKKQAQILVSGSWDKTIKVWRVSTGEEIVTLTEHSDSVTSIAISPYGKILATASKDKTIKLWRFLEQF